MADDQKGPKKILVIDDDQVFRFEIEKKLAEKGYSVETAENGKLGLLKLNAHTIDLVISDLIMPQMSGLQFLHEMKKIEKYKNTPFFLISASVETNKSQILRAAKSGIAGFLLKPIIYEQLFKKIEILVA